MLPGHNGSIKGNRFVMANLYYGKCQFFLLSRRSVTRSNFVLAWYQSLQMSVKLPLSWNCPISVTRQNCRRSRAAENGVICMIFKWAANKTRRGLQFASDLIKILISGLNFESITMMREILAELHAGILAFCKMLILPVCLVNSDN